MSSSFGFAVVGLGTVGKIHVEALKQIERESGRARLVCVVDQVRALAEDVGRRFGARPYCSLDEALKDPEVEVVCVATPSYLHSPQAVAAIEHGKHVVVEKPMSTTLAGAREMVDRAERKGVRLGVVFQERYNPDIRRLKEEVLGELGKIFLVESELKWYRDPKEYYGRDEAARSWRGMWNTEGGGVLTTQGIHTLDLMVWLNGEVSEVCGFAENLTHPSIEV